MERLKVKPNTTCDLCGKKIYRRPKILKKQKNKFCSHACKIKYRHSIPDRSPNTRCNTCLKPIYRCPEFLNRSAYHFCCDACRFLWTENKLNTNSTRDFPGWLDYREMRVTDS